jgi:hypothetical protein
MDAIQPELRQHNVFMNPAPPSEYTNTIVYSLQSPHRWNISLAVEMIKQLLAVFYVVGAILVLFAATLLNLRAQMLWLNITIGVYNEPYDREEKSWMLLGIGFCCVACSFQTWFHKGFFSFFYSMGVFLGNGLIGVGAIWYSLQMETFRLENPDADMTSLFVEYLTQPHINVLLRESSLMMVLGATILGLLPILDAACGVGGVNVLYWCCVTRDICTRSKEVPPEGVQLTAIEGLVVGMRRRIVDARNYILSEYTEVKVCGSTIPFAARLWHNWLGAFRMHTYPSILLFMIYAYLVLYHRVVVSMSDSSAVPTYLPRAEFITPMMLNGSYDNKNSLYDSSYGLPVLGGVLNVSMFTRSHVHESQTEFETTNETETMLRHTFILIISAVLQLSSSIAFAAGIYRHVESIPANHYKPTQSCMDRICM